MLYVTNESTLVSDQDVLRMTQACNIQLRRDLQPVWGSPGGQPVTVQYRDNESLTHVPPGSWIIKVVDEDDTPGALGWHSEDSADHVFGVIAAKPCLNSGSSALFGQYSVSSVLSHEVLEMYVDPFVNAWCDNGRGLLVAQEVCDPVEADGYKINNIQVSNFVLPEWFDTGVSRGEKYDFMGKVKAPFSMSPGGYWVQMPHGKTADKFNETVGWEIQVGFDVRGDGEVVFSPEMPEWRRAVKVHGRNVTSRVLD